MYLPFLLAAGLITSDRFNFCLQDALHHCRLQSPPYRARRKYNVNFERRLKNYTEKLLSFIKATGSSDARYLPTRLLAAS
jgi:hypothetical protein